MMLDDLFINNLPTLDLHGETKDSANMLIKEFVYDNYILKNKKIIVIHGIGRGILKSEVYKVLKTNKYIKEYHQIYYNPGSTIIYLKNN